MKIRRTSGFTLLELLVTIVVVALLIGLATIIGSTVVKRAKKAQCISHMRTLHSSLASYVLDKGMWPQMQENRYNFTEEQFFEFWIKATESYGMSQESWLCPMDRNIERIRGQVKERYYGSYNITRFDKNPATPYRWNQPWAMERGNFHGKGAHILMPDGSIQESMNPFAGR